MYISLHMLTSIATHVFRVTYKPARTFVITPARVLTTTKLLHRLFDRTYYNGTQTPHVQLRVVYMPHKYREITVEYRTA